jgi:Acetyltransferase (GNAT) domain
LAVYSFNPLEDPRWVEFGKRHPRFSIFHATGWLKALDRTYRYEPIVFTTSPPGAGLENGIVFCRVSSWLTGRRLVSLPFADHCEPLIERPEEYEEIFDAISRRICSEKLKYVEIRPRSAHLRLESGLQQSNQFCFHVLDLQPTLPDLFRGFQKDSTQRKIRRAEREGLQYEAGRSPTLLKAFYCLSLLTRRRHRLPPQPIEWFRNLIACLGDRLRIHAAFKDGQAIASILTLRYARTLVYKYGCSDANFHKLGAMPFLFWKAIQEAKEQGLQEFDLGRTDSDNAGLIAFKGHLGATASSLTYLRSPAPRRWSLTEGQGMRIALRVIGHLPGGLLSTAGRLLYKHVG